MRKQKWMVAALVAAGLVATGGPAMASRDRMGDGWELAGGQAVAMSADGPKSSNAYQLNGATGSYVYLASYWDLPLTEFSAGFSYKLDAEIADGDGSPRISVEVSDGDGATNEYIYLDPYHCPSAANAKGWATTDFFRTGSSCTIHTSYGAFTGTDGSLGADPIDPSDDVAATSAWSAAVDAAEGDQVWISYLIADWDGTAVVDRVRFGGSVLSLFG